MFHSKKKERKEGKRKSKSPPSLNPRFFVYQLSETNQQITLLMRLQISPFHEIPTAKQNNNHFSVKDYGSFHLNGLNLSVHPQTQKLENLVQRNI